MIPKVDDFLLPVLRLSSEGAGTSLRAAADCLPGVMESKFSARELARAGERIGSAFKSLEAAGLVERTGSSLRLFVATDKGRKVVRLRPGWLVMKFLESFPSYRENFARIEEQWEPLPEQDGETRGTGGSGKPPVAGGQKEPSGTGGTGEPAVAGGQKEPRGTDGTGEPAAADGQKEPSGTGGTGKPAVAGGQKEPSETGGTGEHGTDEPGKDAGAGGPDGHAPAPAGESGTREPVKETPARERRAEALVNIKNAVTGAIEHSLRQLGQEALGTLARQLFEKPTPDPSRDPVPQDQRFLTVGVKAFSDGPAEPNDLETLVPGTGGRVFVAPAGFTQEALDYSKGLRINTFGADFVARFMFDNSRFVKNVATFEIFTPDPAYFGEDPD
ncbi:MAG: hypothetical protein LBT40_00125 [Deltaproteobacteria bacterium]|jgi:hypothetical protein|nr:hypothetical protein [Deltaproteobacteria bacterium]